VSQSVGVDPSVDSLALDDYDHVEHVERYWKFINIKNEVPSTSASLMCVSNRQLMLELLVGEWKVLQEGRADGVL
jgi:hypothetical protein